MAFCFDEMQRLIVEKIGIDEFMRRSQKATRAKLYIPVSRVAGSVLFEHFPESAFELSRLYGGEYMHFAPNQSSRLYFRNKKIRQCYNSGVKEVAEKFGLSISQVYRIVAT